MMRHYTVFDNTMAISILGYQKLSQHSVIYKTVMLPDLFQDSLCHLLLPLKEKSTYACNS